MGHVITPEERLILRTERQLEALSSATWIADVRNVGPAKPVGYIPLSTLEQDCGVPRQQMMDEVTAKGLKYGFVEDHFYVWDEKALSALLAEHRDILNSAQWPSTVEAFIKQVDLVTADAQTPLFDVIADAFADYRNPRRYCMGPGTMAKTIVQR